jgi:hypothetical protein
MTKERYSQSICFVALLAMAIALSFPLVQANSRYFYQEDDAHHFNHTVEMAKHQTLNPNYFNKPALHFYLRMPIVYASTAWERMHGRPTSTRDIRTRDPYGVSDYAFTASHPTVLTWNRWLSVVWSSLLSIVVLVLLRSLHVTVPIALFGAAVPILSPEVLRNSYIIGVDTLMALLCLLCTAYAIRAERRGGTRALVLCGVLAGLAGAAKYNAAPIAVVPFVLWWLTDRSLRGFLTIAAATLAGFLLGAPYSLISYREFWQGVSYEIWHYGVAGHEQHSATRGLPQALFYLRWLVSDGTGVAVTLLSAYGALALWRANRSAALIIISFPFCYFVMMSMQKANFTRNMVVLVPYVAILGAFGLWAATRQLWRGAARFILIVFCIGAALAPLARATASIIGAALITRDSRDEVVTWLTSDRPLTDDVAVAGPLQLPFSALALPGVDTFDPTKRSLTSLLQSGYRFIVVPSSPNFFHAELFAIAKSIPGETWPQRVPYNPAITILRASPSSAHSLRQLTRFELAVSQVGDALIPECGPTSEQHCWIQSLTTTLALPRTNVPTYLEVMSPWPRQHIEILDSDNSIVSSIQLDSPNMWKRLVVPPAGEPRTFIMRIAEIHSPASQGVSKDARRLGIAIKR